MRGLFPSVFSFLVLACGAEETVTECRTELHVNAAKLICPAFSVVYDFGELRTSIYDRRGRVVVRNATASYTVVDPSRPEGERDRRYEVSDAVPLKGGRPEPKERHSAPTVTFPSIYVPTDPNDKSYYDWDDYRSFVAKAGREVSMNVTIGGPLGEFEQRFVGFSRMDFLLIYTSISSGVKCPFKLRRVSPLEVDGAQQPWSSTRSALFIAGRPENVDVEPKKEPAEGEDKPVEPVRSDYQILRDTGSGRVVFVGQLKEASPVPGRNAQDREDPSCGIGEQTPTLSFSDPGLPDGFPNVRERGRFGFGSWFVSHDFAGDGVIIDTSKARHSMGVLYLDFTPTPGKNLEGDFGFFKSRFRSDNKHPNPPFDLTEPETPAEGQAASASGEAES